MEQLKLIHSIIVACWDIIKNNNKKSDVILKQADDLYKDIKISNYNGKVKYALNEIVYNSLVIAFELREK